MLEEFLIRILESSVRDNDVQVLCRAFHSEIFYELQKRTIRLMEVSSKKSSVSSGMNFQET